MAETVSLINKMLILLTETVKWTSETPNLTIQTPNLVRITVKLVSQTLILMTETVKLTSETPNLMIITVKLVSQTANLTIKTVMITSQTLNVAIKIVKLTVKTPWKRVIAVKMPIFSVFPRFQPKSGEWWLCRDAGLVGLHCCAAQISGRRGSAALPNHGAGGLVASKSDVAADASPLIIPAGGV